MFRKKKRRKTGPDPGFAMFLRLLRKGPSAAMRGGGAAEPERGAAEPRNAGKKAAASENAENRKGGEGRS